MSGENLCLLFHGIREQAESTPYHSELFVTRGEFKDLADWLRSVGYRFCFPWDATENGCVAITLDDGYFNNSRLLPLAEQEGIPLLLFVASFNIQNQLPFVWDVWDAAGRGAWPLTKVDYASIYASLQSGGRDENEDLRQAASKLLSLDAYRPFRYDELQDFASSPLVRLAPHGNTHQPLVGPYRIRLEDEIAKSREFLRGFGSAYVDEFSFPCGLYDRTTLLRLRREFRRVYTIDGGVMKSDADLISRISLVSPRVGGPLRDQIRRWLGWKSRLVRQAVNLRYSHPLLSQI